MNTKTHSLPFAISVGLILLLTCGTLPAQSQTARRRDAALDAFRVPNDKNLRMHDEEDVRLAPEALSEGAQSVEAAAAAAAASGDYRIDALLSGYKWSASTVTYSFYDYDMYHGSYYGSESGAAEVSEPVKTNVRQIMAWYSTLFNLNLVEVSEASGQIGTIRFLLSNGPSYAYSYYPTSTAPTSVAGDVHLNPAYDRLGDTNGFQHAAGMHGYLALVHEIGHTLGLKHSFQGTSVLPTAEDNESHTVMTYTFTGNSPGTPMGYDLMALQYLYGAKALRTGNDAYVLTSRGTDQYSQAGALYLNTPNFTRQAIWDSAGINTLDASGLPFNSMGYTLDLRELGWLVANSVNSGTDFSYGTVVGPGVGIRDVVNSGSSDTIYLNPLPNVVRGYSVTRTTGDDVIYGATASDTLDLSTYGGSVSDARSGDDRVLGLGTNGNITIKNYYTTSPMYINYSPTVPAVSISDATVTEGNSGTVTAVFTVNLSAPTTDALSVNWTTANGTALGGEDFVAASGTVQFTNSSTSETISVIVNGDTVIEPNEAFYVNLTGAANATNPNNSPVISRGIGVGTILTDDFYVNQNPVAAMTANPASGQALLNVDFSSGSYDPDGSIVAYSWNFGDGGSGSGVTASHTYTKTGTFTAVLTVTDNLGAKATTQKTITVTAAPLAMLVAPQGGDVLRSSTVSITATVSTGGQWAAGATVVFSMKVPGTNKLTTKTVTTNSSGVATWNYSVGRKDKTGQYTVTAKATYGSQSVSSPSPGAWFTVD